MSEDAIGVTPPTSGLRSVTGWVEEKGETVTTVTDRPTPASVYETDTRKKGGTVTGRLGVRDGGWSVDSHEGDGLPQTERRTGGVGEGLGIRTPPLESCRKGDDGDTVLEGTRPTDVRSGRGPGVEETVLTPESPPPPSPSSPSPSGTCVRW